MKKAIDNLYKLKQIVDNCKSLDGTPDLNLLLCHICEALEDLHFAPAYYMRYQDNGPSKIGPQAMSVTKEYDKLVLCTEVIKPEDRDTILMELGRGRKNPRFTGFWCDDANAPSNDIVRVK